MYKSKIKEEKTVGNKDVIKNEPEKEEKVVKKVSKSVVVDWRDKPTIQVGKNEGVRTYCEADHGKDYKKIAGEFKKKKESQGFLVTTK